MADLNCIVVGQYRVADRKGRAITNVGSERPSHTEYEQQRREGNHGEDVKEYYYYVDSTPTHSYMKYQYKYAQAEFPYGKLVDENRRRGKSAYEFELIDTGIFDDDRYFDVFVEYAKADVEDILIRISAVNRGPEPAQVYLLPTIWFRNTWSREHERGPRPSLHRADAKTIELNHSSLGQRWLYCDGAPELLFTENETNTQRIFNAPNASATEWRITKSS